MSNYCTSNIWWDEFSATSLICDVKDGSKQTAWIFTPLIINTNFQRNLSFLIFLRQISINKTLPNWMQSGLQFHSECVRWNKKISTLGCCAKEEQQFSFHRPTSVRKSCFVSNWLLLNFIYTTRPFVKRKRRKKWLTEQRGRLDVSHGQAGGSLRPAGFRALHAP